MFKDMKKWQRCHINAPHHLHKRPTATIIDDWKQDKCIALKLLFGSAPCRL